MKGFSNEIHAFDNVKFDRIMFILSTLLYCVLKDITLVTLRSQFGNFGIYFIMTSGLVSIFLSYKLAKIKSDKGNN